MSVEKMKMLNIAAPFEKLNNLLETCMGLGFVQLESAYDVLEARSGVVPLSEENPYSAKLAHFEEIIGDCGIKQKIVPKNDDNNTDEEIEMQLAVIENELKELNAKRLVISNELNEINDTISCLTRFSKLNTDLSQVFSMTTAVARFGKMPCESYEKLRQFRKNRSMIWFSCSSDREYNYVVYITPIDKTAEADRIFSSMYFEPLTLPNEQGTPSSLIEKYTDLMWVKRELLAQSEEAVDFYVKHHKDEITRIYADLKHDNELFAYRRNACRFRDGKIMLAVWIPENSYKIFSKAIKECGGDISETALPDDEHHTPPTKLKNAKLIRPFQFFVETYGVPSYKEIDPTLFVAFTYTLLYGIMFADVGQGIILAIAGLLMYKLKAMKIGAILVPCGIMGTLFGFVFGSVFGFEHWLDPLYKSIGMAGKPFDIMENAVTLLLFSIGIGIALLIAAMCVGVASSLKKRNIGMAVFGANGLAGLVLYLSILLFAGNMLLNFGWNTTIILCFGIILPVICIFFSHLLASVIAGKGLPKQSVSDFIIENFFELFEVILSLFTNTVSFLRVGAFVLIHAGMMTAFLALSEMVGGGVVGVIIMIIGNAFVIVLEGLLVGIQVLRLEFYEMFSRFYDGDGRSFTPVLMSK